MPIYAYRCTSCGHAKDVLQKLSDPALTDCPACGASTFAKQLTAAGFQLKGSGWYATDFKSSNGGAKKPDETGAGKDAPPAADKPGDKQSDKAAETTKTVASDSAGKTASSGEPKASASAGTESERARH